MSDLATTSAAFRRSVTGLELVRTPTFDEWDQLGKWLRAADASMAWLIGDWFLMGEAQFGEQASQAFDVGDATGATGWTEKTLTVYAWVCKRIPKERRRADLPFGCHQIVAGLEPAQQDALLEAAATDPDGAWSTRELRRAVRKERGKTQPPECWVLVNTKDEIDAAWLCGEMVMSGRSAKIVQRGEKE